VASFSEFISIGIVSKIHGIKGELSITPLTDEPEQFNTLKFLYLILARERKLFKVESIRSVRKKIFLKLSGIDDRTSAEALKGAVVETTISELRPLDENEYFIHDLIGLAVKTVTGDYIGVLKDVICLSANDVYLIEDGNKEILIPAIRQVITKVDLTRNEMIIDPIDGLLE